MRLLHTADLHLGRQFMGISLEQDHEAVLDQIVDALQRERVDVLIIAGDVFDRASPPNASVRQFNRFITRVTEQTEAAIVLISGNHDSGDRIDAMSVFPTRARVLVRGIAQATETPLILRDDRGEVAISALPFCHEYAARAVFDDQSLSTPADVIAAQIAAAKPHVPAGARWVVVAHAFVAGGTVGEAERALTRVGGIETVPADAFDGADYVALGHLHRAQSVGTPTIRYSGAPLAFGFDEAGQEKSMTLVDITAKGVDTRLVPFRPLRRVRRIRGAFDDLLAGPPSTDLIQVVLTDSHPLIDPMKRLRAVYPNACHLSYERQPGRLETKSIDSAAAPTTPLEMVAAFLSQVQGAPPDADETDILNGLLQAIAQQDADA